MSTIAAALGGSKGTLWAYFPSKEALFAAVLDDVTAAFRTELADALRPGPGGRPGHIFNLGHGVLPGTSPDQLARLVAHVHEWRPQG